jgi:hypothetical protein
MLIVIQLIPSYSNRRSMTVILSPLVFPDLWQFQLVDGVGTSSEALQVASQANIPLEILNRAIAVFDSVSKVQCSPVNLC